MKNVIFILTYFMGGGIEKIFLRISDILIKTGKYNIYLYVINGIESCRDEVSNEVTIIDRKQDLLKLRKQIRKDNWVIVNFSSDWKSSSISWVLSSKKFISWIHTNPISMGHARTKSINFALLKHSPLIVTVCKEQKKILQETYHFKNNITTIYNAVDIEEAQERSTENLPYNRKYILMVARIDFDTKDFYTVLNAYKLLPDVIKQEYQLVFLGDGPDKELLIERIRELELTDNVFLPGYDPNPYRWYKNATLGILSSKSEGFGVSVIEAMACGCKMILTKYHTGVEEISSHGKFCELVDIGNAEQMAGAIINILNGNFLENPNCKAYISDNFGVTEFSKNIINLFNTL